MQRRSENPSASRRLAPGGLTGWLLVLASSTSSSWPVAEPVWVAIPLAVAGTTLVAWQTQRTPMLEAAR